MNPDWDIEKRGMMQEIIRLQNEFNAANERMKRMERVGDKMLEATVDLGFEEFTVLSTTWKQAKETK